jgi:uncharacterized protein YciI
MFALILTPAKTLEDLKPVQAEHEQYLQKYDASGIFILRGGLTARVGGFLLANVTNEAEMKAIIAEDPYVSKSQITRSSDSIFPNITTALPLFSPHLFRKGSKVSLLGSAGSQSIGSAEDGSPLPGCGASPQRT